VFNRSIVTPSNSINFILSFPILPFSLSLSLSLEDSLSAQINFQLFCICDSNITGQCKQFAAIVEKFKNRICTATIFFLFTLLIETVAISISICSSLLPGSLYALSLRDGKRYEEITNSEEWRPLKGSTEEERQASRIWCIHPEWIIFGNCRLYLIAINPETLQDMRIETDDVNTFSQIKNLCRLLKSIDAMLRIVHC